MNWPHDEDRRLLGELGLTRGDLDVDHPLVWISARASGAESTVVRLGAEQALEAVRHQRVVAGILLDLLTQAEHRHALPDLRFDERGHAWLVVIVTTSGTRFQALPGGGTTEQYATLIRSSLDDAVHDSDIVG